MLFKGLSDRYNERSAEIYGKYSAKDSVADQPYLEIKPNDPKKSEVKDDTRFGAAGSASYRRDLRRMRAFLQSPTGKLFLLRQAELQTGNTFSETRIINPLFVLGNVPGVTRIRRTLDSATGLQVGDGAAVLDSRIGQAGRLQRATKDKVIINLMGARGPSGLLNLLPPNKITRAVSALRSVFGTGENGILDPNDRPEINFSDNQFFSIALWQGFKSQTRPGNPLDAAKSRLRRGDFKGALAQIKNGVNFVVRGVNAPLQTLTNNERGSANSNLDGYRYFILNNTTSADRYLNIVTFDTVDTGIAGQSVSVPVISMPWIKRPTVRKTKESSSTKDSLNSPIPSLQSLIPKVTFTQSETQRNNFWRKAGSISTGVGRALFGGKASQIKLNSTLIKRLREPVDPNSDSPAEDAMTYKNLSVKSRYEQLMSSMQSDELVDTQIDMWKNTIDRLKEERASYVVNVTDPFQDVDPTGVIKSQGDNEPTDEERESIRRAYNDTIDFMFYDFVNKNIIPFRAFLIDIDESSTPSVSEQQYIGRIERNIVYTGVLREVSFSFRIQAFSQTEMDAVWAKINKLTGLTFPAKYSRGFIVPPLTKLTIGNLYVDQPGYIKSLNYKFDTDGWELDVDSQVPMGITVNVAFSIIEKRQLSSQDTFYPYKTAREVSRTPLQSTAPRPVSNAARSVLGGAPQFPQLPSVSPPPLSVRTPQIPRFRNPF